VVRTVFLAEPNIPADIQDILREHTIACKDFGGQKLPGGIPADAVHQGYVAEILTKKLMVSYEDFFRDHAITSDTALAVMGEVQDPHNVGAVIRSAAAFGISAVLIPEHRQAQVTGTVIKVSVGTAFRVPLVQIKNVNHVIADLKERGFWVYGLDMEGSQPLEQEGFEKPSALVLGNEAEGIRKKTLEHCDIVLTIPMSKNAESLNASVAAGVVFYAWSVKHQGRA
jgi:23S rRNA (guanosine2251-2'-O)-methyltransferase